MFGKKMEKSLEIDSVIGEKIKLIGKIQGEGTLRVDGIIEGDIDYNGDVIIGEFGQVVGNIYCNDISVAGTVKGNIETKGNLVLHSSGGLVGDAIVANIIIHENAFFQGSCKMPNEKASKYDSNLEKAANIE